MQITSLGTNPYPREAVGSCIPYRWGLRTTSSGVPATLAACAIAWVLSPPMGPRVVRLSGCCVSRGEWELPRAAPSLVVPCGRVLWCADRALLSLLWPPCVSGRHPFLLDTIGEGAESAAFRDDLERADVAEDAGHVCLRGSELLR